MSAGVYGNIVESTFSPNDHAEVWLSYRENRSVVGNGFSKVETSKYLTVETDGTNPIGGLYQLKLPLEVFNKTGIFNIYIRPKQFTATIQDVGVLLAYPEIRGVVLKTSEITDITIENDSLVGYKIEYFDNNGIKIPNLFRIITSNNKCEPVNQNVTSANQKSISYRFNDSSDLTFLTLTPSSASNAKPNSLPFIGNTQTNIILSNTFFNPEMIEIEMTNNDIESLYLTMNGTKIRSLDNGLVTTYDENNNIYDQVEHYVIKQTATGTPIYEVRQQKENIDFTQDYNTIISIAPR